MFDVLAFILERPTSNIEHPIRNSEYATVLLTVAYSLFLQTDFFLEIVGDGIHIFEVDNNVRGDGKHQFGP